MDRKFVSASIYRQYLLEKTPSIDHRISRHHIIPRPTLESIVDYKCELEENKTTDFCKALLADEVKEFCGFGYDSDSFLWASGNLFLGPNHTCRTEDPGSELELGVGGLMDCFFDNKPGPALGLALSNLQSHSRSLISQMNLVGVACDANSKAVHCINAAKSLNEFYKGYCEVSKNSLYNLDFYLDNFWVTHELSKENILKGIVPKFSLRKLDKYECDSIQKPKREVITDVAAHIKVLQSKLRPASHPFFLESEAVVSNHFHKTKATDSSSFILDDSVDARF